MGFPGGSVVKNLPARAGDSGDTDSDPEWGMALAPVFLPGQSHGWRSLAGDSPQGRKESDRSELLSTHASKRLQLTGVGYFPSPRSFRNYPRSWDSP